VREAQESEHRKIAAGYGRIFLRRPAQHARCEGEREHFVFPFQPLGFVVQHELEIAVAFFFFAGSDETCLAF
jgi:hypothetical protein